MPVSPAGRRVRGFLVFPDGPALSAAGPALSAPAAGGRRLSPARPPGGTDLDRERFLCLLDVPLRRSPKSLFQRAWRKLVTSQSNEMCSSCFSPVHLQLIVCFSNYCHQLALYFDEVNSH